MASKGKAAPAKGAAPVGGSRAPVEPPVFVAAEVKLENPPRRLPVWLEKDVQAEVVGKKDKLFDDPGGSGIFRLVFERCLFCEFSRCVIILILLRLLTLDVYICLCAGGHLPMQMVPQSSLPHYRLSSGTGSASQRY